MPSVSGKQHRFMEAIAHNPGFAKKAGVPQSVGKDFAAADKGRSFKGSAPKTPAAHMQERRAAGGSIRSVASEFGKPKSTVHKILTKGYSPMGGAR